MDDDSKALSVEECLVAISDGTVDLSHLIRLAEEVSSKGRQVAPQVVVESISAQMALADDIFESGLDLAVWNQGPDKARAYGEALCTVGAIENGELLLCLADAVVPFLAMCDGSEDTEKAFEEFRAKVVGPRFRIPELDEELTEALIEYALENSEKFSQ